MRVLFLTIGIISNIFLFGQKDIAVYGNVTDSISNEALIGATVFVKNKNYGTVTNKFGFFSLKVEELPVTISVSYIGYNSKSIIIDSNDLNKTLIIKLKEGVSLQEVHVIGINKTTDPINDMGRVNIPVSKIKSLPALFGETDVFAALQLTPGIQSGGEGKTDLNVRGGSSDQNLILIDDIPIYNISHFGGFLSTVNTDIVNDITLYKGAFPARYGGKLSSVLDFRLKDGSMTDYNFNGMVGLLSSKITASGPIIKDRASFLASFRINTLPIYKVIFGSSIENHFLDINLKGKVRLNTKNTVYVSFFKSHDKVNIGNSGSNSSIDQNTQWGNTGASIRLNSVLTSWCFLNSTAAFSDYTYELGSTRGFDVDSVSLSTSTQFVSSIKDLILKLEPEMYLKPYWLIRFGGVSTFHLFNPGETIYEKSGYSSANGTTYYKNDKVKALENRLYIENNLGPVGFFGANIGVHYSNYKIYQKNTMYSSLEPRLLLNFYLPYNISIKTSYSRMMQYIHFLSFSGVGLPSDYWMPTTKNVPPQESDQYAIGISTKFFNTISFSIESYYKKMNDLVLFKAGESAMSVDKSWEDKVELDGTGIAKGIEFLIQKDKGKTTGWFSATLSQSEQKFTNINNGDYFPFKYDSRYDLSTVVIQKIAKNISFSMSWQYRTGYPLTMPVARYNSFNQEVWYYSKINALRMKSYHRLDIGLNFYKKTKWGSRTINLSIYNLYNRKNPYYYYYDYETIEELAYTDDGYGNIEVKGNMKVYQQSLFPLFPSISYKFNF